MDDRAALLAAVGDRPDDDTPRLVFADYLDDLGDHDYARFIRTQIDLSHVPEWDRRWLIAWHRDREAFSARPPFRDRFPLPDAFRSGLLRRSGCWLTRLTSPGSTN